MPGAEQPVTAGNAQVARAYQRWSRVYDVVFGSALQAGRRQAIRELRLQPGDRLLEVGVGTGLTLPLYPPESHIVGVDYSTDMLEQARRRHLRMGTPRHVQLMRADAAQLPFADASFEVVFAPYVISTVPEPVPVARELRRVCRPDGRVVLLNHFQHEPTPAWFERLLAPLAIPLGFRSDLALSPLLASSGLRPVSIQRVNVPPIWKLVVCAPQ
jgi:phosphatidylethanolamine/phosphatidyl-N-methylethanolamine N-methyltransferase